ncbi:MAG: DUF3320 domain-containing protein [Candidatus Riflebacteria bacterium]|nr:DUF3320 domain-containing protein [Candidatus Riflebacteria bacterium]
MIIDVNVEYDPRVSWAMEANGIPIVQRLTVRNIGPAIFPGGRLSLTCGSSKAEPGMSGADDSTDTGADPGKPDGWLLEPLARGIPSLASGEEWLLEKPDLRLRPDRLRYLVERDAKSIEIEVKDCIGDSILRKSLPVEFLAYNEWDRTRLPELIVAFILPNHPVIAELLIKARDRLNMATGDPALRGYQNSPRDRVKAVAEAIYNAAHEFEITYATSPASFETSGQKIRFPDTVFHVRMANCIEIAVIFAAALEQAGLHAVLVLFRDHALPGVWLVNDHLPVAASDERETVEKLVRCGDLLLFEGTVAMNRPYVPFSEAERRSREQLSDGDSFSHIVDVRAARLARLLPLPVRLCVTPPNIGEDTKHPSIIDLNAAPMKEEEEFSGSGNADVCKDTIVSPVSCDRITRIESWKERLLDLSIRNRLLNFRESRERTIPFDAIDLARLEDSLSRGNSLVMEPAVVVRPDDPRHDELLAGRGVEEYLSGVRRELLDQGRAMTRLDEIELNRRLRAIYRVARTEMEESGSSTLYLGLGFLRWFESELSTNQRLAPIMLYPVELYRPILRGRFVIRLRDDEPRLNDTLLEKLRRDFGLDFSDLKTLPTDDAGIDLSAVLATLQRVTARIPRFDVIESAMLGFFSFTKFLMWRDLDAHQNDLMKNSTLRHFVDGGAGTSFDGQTFLVPEELDKTRPAGSFRTILDSDSSQAIAIDAALRGNSFVLQGPPGTGKSQTIANIIAVMLSEGKRVLFVSEKRAALEVVARRLERVGLGDACLELHSNKANKRQVSIELSRVLEQNTSNRKPAIAALEADAARVADLTGQLTAFVQFMHMQTSLGKTHFMCTAGLCKLGYSNHFFRIPDALAATADVDILRRDRLSGVIEAARPTGTPGKHVFATCRVQSWTPLVARDWERNLTALIQAEAVLVGAGREAAFLPGLPDSLSLGMLTDVERLLDLLGAGIPTGAATVAARPDRQAVIERLDGVTVLGAERAARLEKLTMAFRETLLELDLPAIRSSYQLFSDSFILWRWWNLRGPASILAANAIKPLGEIPEIIAHLDNAIRIQELDRELELEDPFLIEVFGVGAKNARKEHRLVAAVSCFVRDWGIVTEQLGVASLNIPPAVPRDRAASAAAALKAALTTFREIFSRVKNDFCFEEQAVFGNAGDKLLPVRIGERARIWLAAMPLLRDWSRYVAAEDAACETGLAELIALFRRGTIGPESILEEFERGFLGARFEELCNQSAMINHFIGRERERLVESFREADHDLVAKGGAAVAAVLNSRRPGIIGAVNEASEVGILQREARKKRGHLAIRRLLEKIPNLLGRLKPCLLMSPLSIAQYLPATREPFDLVIFDEASQIAVHDAVGAIARGRRAVIVGDSKQLPPTSFFSIDFDTDEDEGGLSGSKGVSDSVAADSCVYDKSHNGVALKGKPLDDLLMKDLESILDEAVAARLPTLMLKWHYRSRDERLIAFSNRHFYDNSLQTFPAAASLDNEGVSLIPVSGVFDRGKTRTNRIEAEAVVSAIIGLLLDPDTRGFSIGVVTFNQPQQMLIEDLLEEARAVHPEVEPWFGERAPEPVFVKNLENVQGDERDVIVFSVTYAADATGRVGMNFGPLNREGGERRLNVAVTRARRRLMVFSSIPPEKIDLSRTQSLGVRRLKVFLAYAAGRYRSLDSGKSGTGEPVAAASEPFEEMLTAALEARGYIVERHVGCSGYRLPLAVRESTRGRFLLGIETDGEAFASGATTRDRERLRREILENLGWMVTRVYVIDWLHDAAGELRRLETIISEAAAISPPVLPGVNAVLRPEIHPEALATLESGISSSDSHGVLPTEPPRCDTSVVDELTAEVNELTSSTKVADGSSECNNIPIRENNKSGLRVYEEVPIERFGQPEALNHVRRRPQLVKLLERIIALEGPIHEETLARRVIAFFGLSRLSPQAIESIRALLDANGDGKWQRRETFVWPQGIDPTSRLPEPRGPTSAGNLREAEFIAPEERAAAVELVLRNALSLPRDILAREAAILMGFKRPSPKVREAFDAGIAKLLEYRFCRAESDRIALADRS